MCGDSGRAARRRRASEAVRATHAPVAADDNSFKLARLAGKHGCGGLPCGVGDERRQLEARGFGKFEGVQAAVGARDRRDHLRRAARVRDTLAERQRSIAPRFKCGSNLPLASLVIFAGPPAMVTRATGCSRRYFRRPPTKSPTSINA
jgi:hypothetical protein